MLRHAVAVLRRQAHRQALAPAVRSILAGLALLLPRQRLGRFFVQPETLLRWHRDLVAKHWTYPHGRPGRPAIAKGTTALVLRLANENPQWGYRRIHGELASMGIVLAPSSVWAILKRRGDPDRPGQSSSLHRRKGWWPATSPLSTRSSSAGSTCSCSFTTTGASSGSLA